MNRDRGFTLIELLVVMDSMNGSGDGTKSRGLHLKSRTEIRWPGSMAVFIDEGEKEKGTFYSSPSRREK